MRFSCYNLDDNQLLEIYTSLLMPRLIEEKMLILLRQGKISKWFSGIGQEAIAVGVALALQEDEYILPMHRNLGIFTTRKVPLNRLFAQWQGKASGFTKGRDRSFHFGTQDHNIVGMISHLGPQMGIADGIALASKLRNEKKVTAVFTGEGGTSEGDFHEALNVAAVWQLPVIFCVENNGYGLSTPINEQYNCKKLVHRAVGYGMDGHTINGNNIIDVYTKVSQLAQEMRENPRPVLIEFETFRMRGHEEASGTKYVPPELLEQWARLDPVDNFKDFLIAKGILSQQRNDTLSKALHQQIDEAWETANTEPPIESTAAQELADVYAPYQPVEVAAGNVTENLRFIDAVSAGLRQCMERHDNLVLMGQDIAEYGGVFKITEGFVERFGKARVRNTPICESAIVEAGYGLAVNGYKAVVEMQFADFASSGFNPIVNLLAKSHYRWGQAADVVVRMPCGAGVGAGPFHSQTNEAWFAHTPGLKVVYPAFPVDAKGLLIAAIEDPNPVMFFEHKALYRTIRQEVAINYYNLPLGKAAVIAQGEKATVVTYGAGVHWALDVLPHFPAGTIDIIDLRTLIPMDLETIKASISKTGRALILTEDSNMGSIASDIAARLGEECFELLDAPVKRVASLDTAVPFAERLENIYLPKERLITALTALLNY
ncbi:MAG: dehydrogenase [Cytophagaceae bacterium]|nr:dehydrogenase [Cytophagaceae bacterium]